MHKRFGLVPENAKKGDYICILYGCSVPVVLRQFQKRTEEVEEEARQRANSFFPEEVEAAKMILRMLRKLVAKGKLEASVNAGSARNAEQQTPKPPLKSSNGEKPLRSDSNVFYQLIGECYVDGMMNGEALTLKGEPKVFELR
ncbi:hypothetical protein F5Y15DRAFT_90122 [Xylariaceae sp. FL0016]|nr:hypothetical protein F5Y15DRAFT_90122 [Xylariaceae sp. FL0016]